MAKIDNLSTKKKVIFEWVRKQNRMHAKWGNDKDFMLALEFDGTELLIYPVENTPFYNIDKLATLTNAMGLHTYAQVQPFDEHFKVTFRIYE